MEKAHNNPQKYSDDLTVAVTLPPHAKYSADRHATIVEAIRVGNSKAVATRLAGVQDTTFHDWCKQGRDMPGRFPQYAKLVEDVEQALAEFEASRVALVKTAGDNGAWQAAAWWLERRKPDDWGRHDRIKHEGVVKQSIQLNQVILKDASARELSRNLLRQLAAGRPDVTIGSGDVLELAENGEVRREPAQPE